MINLCTLSDKNYFRYGLAMHDSLLEQCEQDFTLYYLCLDDETYDTLKEMNLKNHQKFHFVASQSRAINQKVI